MSTSSYRNIPLPSTDTISFNSDLIPSIPDTSEDGERQEQEEELKGLNRLTASYDEAGRVAKKITVFHDRDHFRSPFKSPPDLPVRFEQDSSRPLARGDGTIVTADFTGTSTDAGETHHWRDPPTSLFSHGVATGI